MTNEARRITVQARKIDGDEYLFEFRARVGSEGRIAFVRGSIRETQANKSWRGWVTIPHCPEACYALTLATTIGDLGRAVLAMNACSMTIHT